MSSALVPGLIRRAAPWSRWLSCFNCSSVVGIGDMGPSWSSAIGGGLGRRGELAGDTAEAIVNVWGMREMRERGFMYGFPRVAVIMWDE